LAGRNNFHPIFSKRKYIRIESYKAFLTLPDKTGSDTINILITSTDEEIIDGVKDGFKQVFSHVVVQNQASRSSLAPLPNSFSSALKSAKQRISNLRSSTPAEVGLVVVAVEEFIAEIMPGK
jgi:hypothetical protein